MQPDRNLWELLNFDKITFAADVVAEFAEWYNEDIAGAKFRIGQRVVVIKDGAPVATGEVIGVGTNEDTFEYAVHGYGYLVWENEMEADH